MPEQPMTPEHTAGVAPDTVGSTEAVAPVERAVVDGGHGLAIIASKIERPALSDTALPRPRLVGWFDQQKRARVLLVSAEAGYGKSTLLSDYARSTDATCIWYRLETSDGDWITFLSHLVASVRGVAPDFGQPTEALLRHIAAMGPSRELVVATFLSDLDGAGIAGLTLILDDYHLVEESGDVRVIMARLLERAPASMRFVLAGRGRPSLPLARLVGQGRVAEMTTGDLRFTRSEIEDLFESRYRQPLAPETCDIVESRTEGWAASLQLVSASIATSRPSEVGSFVEALSGAQGPIYDFLAEEVLSRLSQLTQRVLVHASMIDRVEAVLVGAALSVTDEPIETMEVEAALREVERLGLLGHNGDTGEAARFHPLLRQFLEHQMSLTSTADDIKAMHLAVARIADDNDWLVAGNHYAMAGHAEEAMRVLGEAASQALGTGAWGAAAEIVESMPDTTPPPAVEVLKARALIGSGRPDEALRLLDDVITIQLNPTDRALVGLTTAAALHSEGESRRLGICVATVADDPVAPSPLREVAAAWRSMLLANAGGRIVDASRALERLAGDLERENLHYFAGVALHNQANAELARGAYGRARTLAVRAVGRLSESSDGGRFISSTRLIEAMAMAEMGDLEGGIRAAVDAANAGDATADSIAEAAYLCATNGRLRKARSFLARLEKGEAGGSRELSSRAQACYSWFAYSVARGSSEGAQVAIRRLSEIGASDFDASSRSTLISATHEAVESTKAMAATARVAVDTAESQGAWRWAARTRILESIASRDSEALAFWIEEATEESALAILEMADVIAGSVDLLAKTPDLLERSIVQSPLRWVPVLARQVKNESREVAAAAASLVARFGSIDDASVLRDFDIAHGGRTKRRGLVTKLIRRISPTVRVHDLGPTSYEIGDRSISVTETRRKAATLLLYLVARPSFAATREQVMESIWADQTPGSALNSLHQTLFFLRRDIEPWYEEGTTASYVRMESELVYLDSDLFQVDSVAFMRQATEIIGTKSSSSRGPELLRLYKGRFAPEFEYEEWATEWRGQVHGAFLHLAYSTGKALMQEERYGEAAELLAAVAAIDPLAFELRAMLVAALSAVGSSDAALAHYRTLADLHARDLGVPAQPFEQIIAGVGP